MNKEELNKLKSFIQGHKDEKAIIAKLEDIDTEIDIEGGTPLIHAVNYERIGVVTYLIKRGANVNAKLGDYSSLISACESGNLEIVNLLLDAGADITIKDGFGNNALWKATFNEFTEIMVSLLNKGADANELKGNGISIYDSALRMERTKAIEIFDKHKKQK